MLQRALTLVLSISMLVVSSPGETARWSAGIWEETRFHTGCEPGPFHPPPPPEHLQTHYPALDNSPEPVSLHVQLGAGLASPILGSGFNFEHALWSCPEFRSVFRSEILDAFKPAIARVDTGLLPAAPADVAARDLTPAVYQSVLSSPQYADSWQFFRRLNRAGVRVVLGIWGGPAQFTHDGTRLGVLEPAHYDDYVEYVATIVKYIVDQHVQIWATTIANEPDGGDGNQIPPDGLAYIAHQLVPRLAPLGVRLYGPDTANGDHALQYLPLLLEDPLVAENLAFVGFHEYYANPDVRLVSDYVHAQRPGLPLIVTEYTSFGFGDLDNGQEANAQMGFTLDVAATVLNHYRSGVDAALYWDAIDYLQPGHDAITRWGVLRGPDEDFQRRKRYYGLQQILAYLRPGGRVLASVQQGGTDVLQALAARTPEGVPVIFVVNQDFGPVELSLRLEGDDVDRYATLVVTQTDRDRRAERIGRLRLHDGSAQITLDPRSIVTLFPAGAGPLPDDVE